MELLISVQEVVLVNDLVDIGKRIIAIAINLARIVKEDIEHYLEIVSNTNTNGPPTLGVSVDDTSEVKAIFG